MPERSSPTDRTRYEIVVGTRLATRWAAELPGFAVLSRPDGATTLVGTADQAGLHGALALIRDLGVPLVSVRRLEGTDAGDPPAQDASATEITPTAP